MEVNERKEEFSHAGQLQCSRVRRMDTGCKPQLYDDSPAGGMRRRQGRTRCQAPWLLRGLLGTPSPAPAVVKHQSGKPYCNEDQLHQLSAQRR